MARKKVKKKVRITIVILVLLGLFFISTSVVYCYLASPVDKNSNSIIEVEIKNGMSSRSIGKLLEKRGVIRNGDFFLLYTKLNDCKYLKAATYEFRKNMNLAEILEKVCKGNNLNKDVIRLTFKEGRRLTDYAELISKETTNSYDDVISTVNDKKYLKTLIEKYYFLTDDILNEDIYYPLEGYLFPDTYEFINKDVSIKVIIEKMLDREKEMLDSLNDALSNKHTLHEYITLASMLELEGTNDENRSMIAGIFENRLNKAMNLGSDVTTYYAFQKPMTKDLTTSEFEKYNPYNTRSKNLIGLPVGPICMPSLSSLKSALKPTDSSYLYFVADKLGNIYYTKTNSEHLKKVQEIKEAGNWIW